MRVRKANPSYRSYSGRLNRQRVDISEVPKSILKEVVEDIEYYLETVVSTKKEELQLQKIRLALLKGQYLTERQFDVAITGLKKELKEQVQDYVKRKITFKEVFSKLGTK